MLSLSAGGGSTHPDINSFGIDVSLTPKGLKNYERILVLVFNYVVHSVKIFCLSNYIYNITY